MFFYPFHIGDYKAATAHLTNEEDLAYRRLLDMYYDTETCIKPDLDWLSKRLRCDRNAISTVLNDFFTETNEGWLHIKCESIMEEIRTAAGKKGYAGTLRQSPHLKGFINSDDYIQAHVEGTVEAYKADAQGRYEASIATATLNDVTATLSDVQPSIIHNPKSIIHNPNKKQIQLPAPDGVSLDIWESFLLQRKKLRAVVTPTVIKTIANEAQKAGWTLEQALNETVARGWRGFKADWVIAKLTESERRRENMSQLTQGYATGERQKYERPKHFWELETDNTKQLENKNDST